MCGGRSEPLGWRKHCGGVQDLPVCSAQNTRASDMVQACKIMRTPLLGSGGPTTVARFWAQGRAAPIRRGYLKGRRTFALPIHLHTFSSFTAKPSNALLADPSTGTSRYYEPLSLLAKHIASAKVTMAAKMIAIAVAALVSCFAGLSSAAPPQGTSRVSSNHARFHQGSVHLRPWAIIICS